MDDLRDQVRARMEAMGITASELARRAGIARPSVYRWMNGHVEATTEWLDRLGKPLGLKLRFVRGRKHPGA